MDMHDLTRELVQKNDTKIVMLVADGLGGLPLEPSGLTELETARTPNLDALAAHGARFTFAHSHVPITLPSHTSILSGRLPYEHRVRDNSGLPRN